MFSMAWRETRGAWRHFLYFFVCVAIGVSAVVGVSLFAAGVGVLAGLSLPCAKTPITMTKQTDIAINNFFNIDVSLEYRKLLLLDLNSNQTRDLEFNMTPEVLL